MATRTASSPPSIREIFLRRRHRVLLEPGTESSLPMTYIASLLKNVESLGFTCSPALIERMTTLSERALLEFYGPLIACLRRMVGAHVEFEPMYPNFPQQVMDASEAELYVNAIMHYLGDMLGVRIMPRYEKQPRPPLADSLDLKVIDLGDDGELREIAKKLIGAKTSISDTDKRDVAALLAHYRDDVATILPGDIPHKENLGYVTGLLLDHPAADMLLTRYFKTATDVLRLATALSDGDVSLAGKTRFRSFKRAERRVLLSLVERCKNPVEDMSRHKGKWIRLGERLHPGEYGERFPETASAFAILRNNKPVVTFNSKVEKALERRDVAAAVGLLRDRPGELARRLDHLLRLAGSAQPDAGEPVVAAFDEVADKVATPVLLQLYAHFTHRNSERELRSFFPKGNVAKLVTIEDELPKIAEPMRERVVTRCYETLLARFGELPALGKVYLDDALAEHLVPFSQRSSSKGLRTLVRGSRLPIPEGNTIRFFLWWKEGEVEGQATGRVDIDLSAGIYDDQWAYHEHISYTHLKSSKFKAVHSGDITSAPNGACEFIDIDITSALKKGARYVVMSVLSYSQHPFYALPECFAGWMMRKKPKSGEVFEPSTVVDRIDLAADTRVCIPVIIDLASRVMYWADLALTRNPAWVVNIEANQRGIVTMARSIIALVKPNLYQLFELHTRARGDRVDTIEEADTVFSLHEGITPFSIEQIMADFL